MEDSLYNSLDLGNILKTKNLKRYLMQEIMMNPTSDTTWDIAPPSQEQLFNKIGEAIQSKNQSINLRLTYTFNRKNPPGNQEVSHSIAIDVTKLSNNMTILSQLYESTNPNFVCSEGKSTFIHKS